MSSIFLSRLLPSLAVAAALLDGAAAAAQTFPAADSATAVVQVAARSPMRRAPLVAGRPISWFGTPYAAEPEAPRGAGTLIDGLDLAPEGARATTRRFQLFDRLVLTLPRDVRPAVGTAVLLVRRGPSLGGAQVLLPTGLAVIDGQQEGFVTARLDRVFDVVEAGHAVVALPAPPSDVPSGHVAPGETRVAWVAGSAELPTVKSIVVLAATARDGVREGDRYELVGDGRRIPGGPFLPGTRAAVVRVVRVTDHGASAIVESQQQPAIAAGMLARPLGGP
ncbi:MAG: hypothetical protein JO180_10570 [Gemmatirosa sp.]|nr:hypothetical protein [Gemmatirosa sp.]